jgi:hypothetical protein
MFPLAENPYFARKLRHRKSFQPLGFGQAFLNNAPIELVFGLIRFRRTRHMILV